MAENIDYLLLVASRENNINELIYLLDIGADINIRSENGFTALIYACINNNIDIVKILINSDADINIKNDKGQTALMCAIERGHYQIMSLLLLHVNNDLTLTDDNNLSAVDYYNNNFELINQDFLNLGYTNEQIMNLFNPFNH